MSKEVKMLGHVPEENCEFDPVRDIQPVDPTGYVDLAQMNAMNSVPALVPVSEEHYNGIDDPNSIAGRPSDEFEAMQAAKVISGYKAPVAPVSGSDAE